MDTILVKWNLLKNHKSYFFNLFINKYIITLKSEKMKIYKLLDIILHK